MKLNKKHSEEEGAQAMEIIYSIFTKLQQKALQKEENKRLWKVKLKIKSLWNQNHSSQEDTKQKIKLDNT